ncbi:MAG: response regulator [Kouleothrix sp.]
MTDKILVVDDSKLVTDIVKMRLSMYGLRVQLAHSGEEALAKIADDVPDLMVLDVQMPGIDGYEVCQRLRNNPALDDLRIIMLTSSDDKSALPLKLASTTISE